MSPSQQKLLHKDNKPFEFGHEPKAFYVSDDMLQVKVFSGSDDSWIVDKFNIGDSIDLGLTQRKLTKKEKRDKERIVKGLKGT